MFVDVVDANNWNLDGISMLTDEEKYNFFLFLCLFDKLRKVYTYTQSGDDGLIELMCYYKAQYI